MRFREIADLRYYIQPDADMAELLEQIEELWPDSADDDLTLIPNGIADERASR
jgi:hypothetical protein